MFPVTQNCKESEDFDISIVEYHEKIQNERTENLKKPLNAAEKVAETSQGAKMETVSLST